jgi:hypothetical protein
MMRQKITPVIQRLTSYLLVILDCLDSWLLEYLLKRDKCRSVLFAEDATGPDARKEVLWH